MTMFPFTGRKNISLFLLTLYTFLGIFQFKLAFLQHEAFDIRDIDLSYMNYVKEQQQHNASFAVSDRSTLNMMTTQNDVNATMSNKDTNPLIESNTNINLPPPTTTKPTTKKEEISISRRKDAVMGGNNWQMGCIVLEQYKLVFCFIPKIGCTIFKQLFRRMEGKANWRLDPHYMGDLKTLRNYNASTVVEMMTSPDWTRAIFFRDPKERLLSSFLDKALSNHGYYLAARCCVCNEGEVGCTVELDIANLKRNKWVNGECMNKLQTFENFLSHLEKESNSGCATDPHWRPQTERIDDKFIPYINFIGHMDTVSADTERLLRQVGAWHPYGAVGWGKNQSEAVFQSKSASIRVSEAKLKLGQYYTPELEERAEKLYVKDYMHPVFNVTRSLDG